MATANLVENVIVLDVPYTENYLAKDTPGMRYHVHADVHRTKPHYVLPLSWASCVTLRGVFGENLTIGKPLVEWARMELGVRVKPAMDLRNRLEPDPVLGYRYEAEAAALGYLRPYQIVGAAFLATAGSAILADQMRVGKTPQTLAAAKILGALPLLAVVPNSAKYQWVDQIAEFWPEARPVIARGTAAQRRKAIEKVQLGEADVLVINWEALRLHSRQEGFGSVVALAKCPKHGGDATERACELHPRELNEIKWRAVIADEAHRAVHPRAKQTRALWAIGWEADHRFALSGTSILDSPEDLWALMHFVAPTEATQKTSWIDRYCVVGFNGFAEEVTGLRADTREELFRYVDPRFLRRTREMVMPWLPPKIAVQRTVELGTKQRKAYDEMRKTMLAELDDGDLVVVTNALTKLTRLRQFASAYAFINEDGDLRMQAPSSKADAMVEVAEELGGKPAVVWAESRQLVEITGAALIKAGYTVGYFTGTVSDTDRERAKQAFQRGDLQFLCATIDAARESLTLDRADVAVFLQRSFALWKNQQAEDRIVGQHAGPGLEIIDLVATGTVEERVLEVLGDKERIVEEVVRDVDTYRRLIGA